MDPHRFDVGAYLSHLAGVAGLLPASDATFERLLDEAAVAGTINRLGHYGNRKGSAEADRAEEHKSEEAYSEEERAAKVRDLANPKPFGQYAAGG